MCTCFHDACGVAREASNGCLNIEAQNRQWYVASVIEQGVT